MSGNSFERAVNEPVELVAYDESWPERFRVERDRLMGLFPDQLLEIEHFGSTAVPGMSAKPVIDMLGGVTSMAAADRLMGPLLDAGYATSHAYNAGLQGRRWLMRHAGGRRTHHLHLVVHDGEEWHRRLDFRDALRSNPDLRTRYAAFKKELAERHRLDRESYTDAKADFVRSVIGKP